MLSLERPDDDRNEQEFSDPCTIPRTDPNADAVSDSASDDPPGDQEWEEKEQDKRPNKGSRNMLRVGTSADEHGFDEEMDSDGHDKVFSFIVYDSVASPLR
mmetsp:Transcript_38025/g.38428  ORF Transcript_38025/g.38428 Transcript_38025/m.38428 type:complete len:101 (+) Transcript_38025:107-409(+)